MESIWTPIERLLQSYQLKTELLRKHVQKQALQSLRSEGHISVIPSQASLTGDASASRVFLTSPLPSRRLKVKTVQGLWQIMGFGDWNLEATAEPLRVAESIPLPEAPKTPNREP